MRFRLCLFIGALFFALAPAGVRTSNQPCPATTHDSGWVYAIRLPGQPPAWCALDRRQSPLSLTSAERHSLQRERRYHASFVPNDPSYPLQWNFSAVNASGAWDADTLPPVHGGDPAIIVAVLDTGLAYEQYQNFKSVPDYENMHLWTNSQEIPGDGIDNDHDGYVDDVHGWDFLHGDAHPDDDNGHGTHIIGTIAESSDNGQAAAGLAYNTTIMPLKVLDANGDGLTSTIANAMGYAVAHGANIINLSLGGTVDDPVLHQAIKDAAAQGVVIVVAAGNENGAVNYPARYPEVISVGAVRYDQQRASYSNFGPELSLVAPGGEDGLDQNHDGQPDGIVQETCAPKDCSTFGLYYLFGTSQAAAHVAAAAALLESCGVSGANVAGTLKATASDLGSPGRDDQFGAGLLNIGAALQQAGCQQAIPAGISSLALKSNSRGGKSLRSGVAYAFSQPSFQWNGPPGATFQIRWGLASGTISLSRQTDTAFRPTLTAGGRYLFGVSTVDAVGQKSKEQLFYYQYQPSTLAVSYDHRIENRGSDLAIRSVVRDSAAAATRVSLGNLTPDKVNYLSSMAKGNTLRILDSQGRAIQSVTPFGRAYAGGITTAVLHLATRTVLVAAMSSNGSDLAWLTSAGQLTKQQPLFQSYRGGITIASGDFDGNGYDEVAVAQVSGAEIRVYDGNQKRLSVMTPLGKAYRGGWSITAADTNNDGRDEIIAVPRQAGRSIPVFVLSADGSVATRWTMRLPVYAGPLAVSTVITDGTGQPSLLVMPTQGKVWLQLWTLDGVLKKEKAITTAAASASLSSL